MDYLGLFCLGVFAGTIATIGLDKIQSLTDWRQMLVVTLPVLLSGAAIVLVERFRYSPAAGALPLGLIVALLWSTIAAAFDRIKSSKPGAGFIGWAHIIAATGLTVAAVCLVVPPAVEQVLAELDTPREVQIKELRLARSRANGTPPVPIPAAASAAKRGAASAPEAASGASGAASKAAAPGGEAPR